MLFPHSKGVLTYSNDVDNTKTESRDDDVDATPRDDDGDDLADSDDDVMTSRSKMTSSKSNDVWNVTSSRVRYVTSSHLLSK